MALRSFHHVQACPLWFGAPVTLRSLGRAALFGWVGRRPTAKDGSQKRGGPLVPAGLSHVCRLHVD